MAQATPALIYFAGTLEIILAQKSGGLASPSAAPTRAVQGDLVQTSGAVRWRVFNKTNIDIIPIYRAPGRFHRGVSWRLSSISASAVCATRLILFGRAPSRSVRRPVPQFPHSKAMPYR